MSDGARRFPSSNGHRCVVVVTVCAVVILSFVFLLKGRRFRPLLSPFYWRGGGARREHATTSAKATVFAAEINSDTAASLSLRPAAPEDFAFYSSVYPDLDVDAPPLSREAWIKELLPDTLLVTAGSDTPVCYLSVRHCNALLYILFLVVAQDWRRRGVATRSLQLLKDMAVERGYKKMGLHCNVLHDVPYRLYLKAGMTIKGRLTHVKAPIESIAGYERPDSRFTAVAVDDPSEWPELECKCKIPPGNARLNAAKGRLPTKLVDDSGRAVGYILYVGQLRSCWGIWLESLDHLPVLLEGAHQLQTQGYGGDPLFEHFWIEGDPDLVHYMLAHIDGARICEKEDYLETDLSISLSALG